MQNINYLYNRNLNLAEMVLSIFNPDTDLALANGKGNYTPTEGVRQMISDLSLLPIWYTEPGSYVLTDTLHIETFMEEMTQLFGLNVKLLSMSELKSSKEQNKIAEFIKIEPFDIYPW